MTRRPTRSALRRALIGTTVGVVGLGAAVTAITVGGTTAADRSADLAAQIDPSQPRNVILLIGDGTDDSIITAARNYEKGADGRFAALDALPFTGDMTTHGLKVGPGPDYPIAYVSDSAPTASGWSTGRKTVDGRVSQGPSAANNVAGEDYPTALEILRDRGLRTGNVSTAELTDATPAAAASHINARACQGPDNMAACPEALKSAGGKGSIAEQLVDNRVDVLLGGGANRFNQEIVAGTTVRDYAESTHNYRVLETATDLNGITSLEDGPVLGLFTPGNMTPRYEPLVASPPPGAGDADARCTTADRGTEPDLAAMTEKAIELLDNPQGFFLQVESAMVDKQEHASDICGSIGDVAQLDEAVQVALDYQDENPDTLIIVTSDHAHSTQIVPNASAGRQTATLKTADGDPMYIAYSTQASGSSHTGTQVRVAAKGPQAANVTGLIDQTELFSLLVGREPSQLPVNTVTETVTVTGPTATVPGPSVTTTVPGPSVTTTVPGPAVTTTVPGPGVTTTVPGPAVTTTVPGPAVTTTVPGPSTTVRVPAPTPAPRVSLAAPRSIGAADLRRPGLTAVVAAQNATRVRVELVRGNRRLAVRAMAPTGGRVVLRSARVVASGPAQLRVVATGRGGSRTATQAVRIG